MSEHNALDLTANPAPLGLCGFGMTTILLNIHNAGFFPLDSTIVMMGIVYGGLAQIITGIMEWKKGNTFGTTAFTSYGFFWLSLVGIWLLPETGKMTVPNALSMTCYLGIWGLFTLGLWFGTLKAARSLRVVFGLLAALFFLLSAASATGSHQLHIIAGYVGIACGASAFYTAIAQVLNGCFQRRILPL